MRRFSDVLRMKPPRENHGALTLDDLRRPDNASERRREPRIPHQREIVILPTAAPHEWAFTEVTLFDCSRHGIGIISDREMKRGSEFLAKLKVKRMTMVLY